MPFLSMTMLLFHHNIQFSKTNTSTGIVYIVQRINDKWWIGTISKPLVIFYHAYGKDNSIGFLVALYSDFDV